MGTYATTLYLRWNGFESHQVEERLCEGITRKLKEIVDSSEWDAIGTFKTNQKVDEVLIEYPIDNESGLALSDRNRKLEINPQARDSFLIFQLS